MAGSDPVTWDELDKFCAGKQANCHALHEEKAQRHALEVETERRKGYSELQVSIDKLAIKMGALEEMWSSKAAWFLPRPVIYLLVLGGIGIGLAGRDLVTAAMKHFGLA